MDEALIAELRAKYKSAPMGDPGFDVNRCLNRIEDLARDVQKYMKLRELVEQNLLSGEREELIQFLDDTK